ARAPARAREALHRHRGRNRLLHVLLRQPAALRRGRAAFRRGLRRHHGERAVKRFIFAAAIVALAATATAQTYPAKPVRIIVPFAPGGSVDLIARMLAQRLSERMNGSFVVDNRAGGGSNIGAEAAARSAPDGYTLFMASTAQAVNATLYPKLNYDLVKDFAPVSL